MKPVTLGPRGQTFVRAAIGLAASRSGGPLEAADYIGRRHGWGDRARDVVKEAVSAGTTDPSSWSGPLVGDFNAAATEFYAAVSELSIVGRLTWLRRVPSRTPFLTPSSEPVAHWPGESGIKPVTAVPFVRHPGLKPLKVVAVVPVTTELLESANPAAEGWIRGDMLRAVVHAIDDAFINPLNDGLPGQMPAAITNGVAAVSSTGTPQGDFRALVDDFDGDLTTATLVLSPGLAAAAAGTDRPSLSVRGSGSWAGIPTIVSRHVPAGVVALIDAGAIALVEEGAELRAIREGDIIMDDGTGSPPSLEMVSLWQTNCAAIVVGRFVAWQVVRAGAVSLITDAEWAAPA